jgi:hypothetical protein
MAIQGELYYLLRCDRCGVRSTEGSEYGAWGSKRQAEDDAEDGGWWIENGNHLCEECVPHPPDWDFEHQDLFQGKTDTLDCKWCN